MGTEKSEQEKIFPNLQVRAGITLIEEFENSRCLCYYAILNLEYEMGLGKNAGLSGGPISRKIPIKPETYYRLKALLSQANSKNPKIRGKSTLEFSVQTAPEKTNSEEGIL